MASTARWSQTSHSMPSAVPPEASISATVRFRRHVLRFGVELPVRFEVEIGDRYHRAQPRQAFGVGASEPAPRTGDDRNLPVELAHQVSSGGRGLLITPLLISSPDRPEKFRGPAVFAVIYRRLSAGVPASPHGSWSSGGTIEKTTQQEHLVTVTPTRSLTRLFVKLAFMPKFVNSECSCASRARRAQGSFRPAFARSGSDRAWCRNRRLSPRSKYRQVNSGSARGRSRNARAPTSTAP